MLSQQKNTLKTGFYILKRLWKNLSENQEYRRIKRSEAWARWASYLALMIIRACELGRPASSLREPLDFFLAPTFRTTLDLS
jgi:3-methyladenine DNA glycosylase/8-oxoguanine DNA glycosylase